MSDGRLLVLALVGLLAACGFEPVYGERNAAYFDGELAAVEVGPISTRQGQLLRDALIDRIDRRGRAATARRYRLDVELSEAVRNVAVQRDTVSTRANLTLTARYRLIDRTTGTELLAGRAQTVSAYDVTRAPFTTQTSADDARRTGNRNLASAILNQLLVYFSGVAAGQTPEPGTP